MRQCSEKNFKESKDYVQFVTLCEVMSLVDFKTMQLSSTKEPRSQPLLSDGNMVFLCTVGFTTILKTAWLFVRMGNNTELPEVHFSLPSFTRLMKKLSGKVLSTSGLLCAEWTQIDTVILLVNLPSKCFCAKMPLVCNAMCTRLGCHTLVITYT